MSSSTHSTYHPAGRAAMSSDENGEAIEKRCGKELTAIGKDLLPLLLRSKGGKARKYIRLKELATKSLDLIAPNIPCKARCSYCCHVAVGISETEARSISAFTGRDMAKIVRPSPMIDSQAAQKFQDEAKDKYYGKPCTFLGLEGECTVYEARPMPCRTFHVIEDSPERCDMFDGQVTVAQYDIIFPFEMATVALFVDEVWADIREWFPDPIA
jgi:Fe-S-cluster containining protein